MLHATQLLPVLALAASAIAQVGWVQRQPATVPPSRGYHALTYDVVRNKTVMFGGFAFSGTLSMLADTWEWNGTNWTQRLTPNTPPARRYHALASDIVRGRVVLFGGGASSGDLNDTWEYDGTDWTQMQPATAPSARQGARIEFDVARGRTVLFGGSTGPFMMTAFNDTWEWDGVHWMQRAPATSPMARYVHGMTYDFARARIVLFGGATGPFGTGQISDTWAWDGTDWTPLLQNGPPAFQGFGFTNDAAKDFVVWCGGGAASTETWLFDHVAWRSDPRSNPGLRNWSPLAHDLLRGRTVMFGGTVGLVFFNDTWEYDPGTVARWNPFGSGCQGTAGVPTLRPVGGALPIVGTTFVLELLGVPGATAAISIGFSNAQWNGNPLPWNLGAIGMTGCTLHANPEMVFFAPVAAGRAMVAWPLPNDPGLVGVRFFDQGFVTDPGINPLGATVSNAGAGIIGPF